VFRVLLVPPQSNLARTVRRWARARFQTRPQPSSTTALRTVTNRIFCSIVLCAWLAIAKPLVAESLEDNPSVDMSALSCADLLRMPLPEALIVVGWIGGFYAGLRNDPRVQLSIFADDADRILNLCRTNQSTSVMTLVERTFGLVRPPTRQGAQ